MITEKYISRQKHPTLDLYIHNYTHRAQFDRVWNEETLQCRGLIMDSDRNIVSRPFRKFFNLGELSEDVDLSGDFSVTEKMDGSLGISYITPAGMGIATRGSFVSDQALKAQEILKSKYGNVAFWGHLTYLFEIIYPNNRIVVDYAGKEDLILLSIIETASGKELSYDQIVQEYGGMLPIVPRFDGITDFEKVEQRPNSEGYVVHYPSTGLRFKLKFEEYVRLHKIVTGVNKKRIWEYLRDDLPLDDLLDRVPDEFYAWVSQTAADLRNEAGLIYLKAYSLYAKVKDLPTRKEQAIAIKDSPYRGIVFNLLDGKPYRHLMWKMIEPEFERPFKAQDESVA